MDRWVKWAFTLLFVGAVAEAIIFADSIDRWIGSAIAAALFGFIAFRAWAYPNGSESP